MLAGTRLMSADLTPPTNLPPTAVSAPPIIPSSLLPMDPLQLDSPRPKSRLRGSLRWIALAVLAVGITAITIYFVRPRAGTSDVLTAPVARGDLPVTVTERGELDSIKSVMVRCEVEV